jgi:hypothetical protein
MKPRRDYVREHRSPMLAISSIVKVLLGRDEPCSSTNPSPSGAVVAEPARKPKEPPPMEAALERSQTGEGPIHTFENASLERKWEHIACSTRACDTTHCVDKAPCPSIHRRSRSNVASTCRMDRKYMEPRKICE